jgi:hypothetical protein
MAGIDACRDRNQTTATPAASSRLGLLGLSRPRDSSTSTARLTAPPTR